MPNPHPSVTRAAEAIAGYVGDSIIRTINGEKSSLDERKRDITLIIEHHTRYSEVVERLRRLANATEAALWFEEEVREAVGNTNYNAVTSEIKATRNLLTSIEKEGVKG